MTKYVKSQEALPSNLHLWDPYPTQTAINETRVMEFFPVSSIENSDTVTFTIPAMQKCMLDSVEIVTELRVLTANNENPAVHNNVSTAPHLAAALWRNVNVSIGNKSLTQSFDNSYAIFKFWDSVLHNQEGTKTFLRKREGVLLDACGSKAHSENVVYFPVAAGEEGLVPDVVNRQGRHRAERIQQGRKVCLVSDFNVALFNQSKLLPSNLELSVQLTKNYSEFILLSAANNTNKIVFDRVSLRCTFQRPNEVVLSLIEERLARENAIYHSDKKMLTFHSLTEGAEEVTIDNVFTGTLPYFFIYGVQDRIAFGRSRHKNPFSLHKMKSTNVHVNGQPHYVAPPESTRHDDAFMFSMFADQCGRISQGDSLLNHHYEVYPAMACDLTQDKTQNQSRMNLSKNGSVRIMVGFEEVIPANRVLMILAYYDQIIEITKEREVIFV